SLCLFHATSPHRPPRSFPPRRSSDLAVLVLEDLPPALPTVHLPQVHDARPVAGRPRLLPGADQDAGRATRCPRARVALVGLGPGADDVDRLVQVELRVGHSGARLRHSSPRRQAAPACPAASASRMIAAGGSHAWPLPPWSSTPTGTSSSTPTACCAS